MARRGKLSRHVCEASGVVKGRRVTVRRVDEIDLASWGQHGFVMADWKPRVIDDAIPCDGWLIPATFTVGGLDFSCDFDVGLIDDGQQRYGITRASFGAPDVADVKSTLRHPASGGIDLDHVSLLGLLRLALRATSIRAIYLPQGSVVGIGGVPTGERLGVGDDLRSGFGIYGVNLGRRKDGRPFVKSYSRHPDPLLLSIGGKVTNRDLARLTRQRPVGRRPGLMSDPESLRLVAALYERAQSDPHAAVAGVPAWVRERLAVDHGVPVSDSWVRQMGVKARKAGLLKSGKRTRKGGR